MSKDTKIEWAHHTVNFWWGCTFARYLKDDAIRDECMHCYAKTMSALFSKGKATWGADGKRWLRVDAAWRELYDLGFSAYKRGVRERVFVNSMSDTFEDRADLDRARLSLFALAAGIPNLDILLLTKRPANVVRMVPADWLTNWPAHVWIGTTAGTQRAVDENLDALVQIPAHVRFLSVEPLLEKIELGLLGTCPAELGLGYSLYAQHIHWVICGGESGPKARPMHPAWARALRDECQSVGVPFFFKQWGEWIPWEWDEAEFNNAIVSQHGKTLWNDDAPRDPCNMPKGWDAFWFEEGDVTLAQRVGKAAAGRRLDGVEHSAFPVTA